MTLEQDRERHQHWLDSDGTEGARFDRARTRPPGAAAGLRCEWVELGGNRYGGEALFRALGLPPPPS